MSTKIYNAYRICDDKVETVFKIKKGIEPLYKSFIFKYLDTWGKVPLKNVKEFLARNSINLRLIQNNDFDCSVNELHFLDLHTVLDEFRKSRLNEPLNFEASMVLYEHKGNLYIQFFGLNDNFFDAYFKKLEKEKIIIDWHYQNSTDKPDNISDDNWDDRWSIWDDIYEDYYTPAQVGFCHDFFSNTVSIVSEYTELRRNNKESEKLK